MPVLAQEQSGPDEGVRAAGQYCCDRHFHCSHWPECCCWCGRGLEPHEQGWQNIEPTPRSIAVMAQEGIDAA